MFDERAYTDRYDLYRPTVATSASHTQTLTLPGSVTESSKPCLLFPKSSAGKWVSNIGADVDFDAVLLYPYSQTLKPAQSGQQPDYVVISSRTYLVVMAWPAAGRTYYNRALLKERRP